MEGKPFLTGLHTALVESRKEARRLAHRVRATARFLRQSFPEPSYAGEPVSPGAWPPDMLAGVIHPGNGNDDLVTEMRKVKAAGFDWVELGWWGYHFPILDEYRREDNFQPLVNLLDPARRAAVKVLFYTHNLGWGGKYLAQEVPNLHIRGEHTKHNPVNWHHPRVQEAMRETYRWLADKFREYYPNTVFALVFNCETKSVPVPSAEAKAPFLAWLRHKYGKIETLNQAWRTDFADWGSVEEWTDIPKLDNAHPREASRAAADWYLFSGDAMAVSAYAPMLQGIQEGWPELPTLIRGPTSPSAGSVLT